MATPTPLGAIGRGLAAGVVGTALMTAWQAASAKLQDSGEDSGGGDEQPDDPWEEAPAPAQVARRVARGVFGEDLPADSIGTVTNVMHWSYGIGWGSAYGLLAGTRGRSRLRDGLLFGTGVWLASYVQLVPMGLYEPPWRYGPGQLAMDLSYHLVYGAGTAGAYGVLDRGR